MTITNCYQTSTNYTDFEFTWLRAAADALQDDDLEAFKRNIKEIDMSGYRDPGGIGAEYLIPAFIITDIMGRYLDNGTEYVQAVLDRRPNLDLPFIKGKSFSYIDFLTQSRSVINSSLSNNRDDLEVELDKMALLLEMDFDDVLFLFSNSREELEAELQKITFILSTLPQKFLGI